MNKLLVICGQTATGKTSLALHLSKLVNGEIISADSMQVYKGMDVGTGKDIPKDARWCISKIYTVDDQLPIGYWETKKGVRIWGHDLVEPWQEFSISHYLKYANLIIKNINSRGKLPILVGGTGLYIKGVSDGIDTVEVSSNDKLRKELEGQSVGDLYTLLSNLDEEKARSLNDSDRKNPRRLIRAIEIAKSKFVLKDMKNKKNFNSLFIGLSLSKSELEKKIKNRVEKRIDQGMIEETKNILQKSVNWNSHSLVAFGYIEIGDYLMKNNSLEETKKRWIKKELQYAKRQRTWFKKDKRIIWFDVKKGNWKDKVEKIVLKWHNET